MRKILAILLLFTATAFAGGMKTNRTTISYHQNITTDSALAYFIFDNDTTSIWLLPDSGSASQDLIREDVTLDSVGDYRVVIYAYLSGSPINKYTTTYTYFPDLVTVASDVSQIKGYVDTEVGVIQDTLNSLSTQVAALSSASGSGPYLCSLFVGTGAGSAMTGGFSRMSNGATRWTSDINGSGWAVYNLTAGTWSGLVYVTGYKQDTIPQTFVISDTLTDTITVTAQNPANPTDPSLVRVYAWTDNILGDTLQGAIMTAIPRIKGRQTWTAANNRIVLPRQEYAVADDSGYVYLDLHPTETTNNADGDSLYYDIQISKGGYPTATFDKFTVYSDSAGATEAVQ